MALRREWVEDEPAAWASEDDAALALRARGDRAAFGILYDRYVDRIFRYCFRRLGSREAAEDATSAVFMKAITALGGYQERPGGFRAWIFTIAHNVVIDTHRRNRHHVSLDASSGPLASSPRLVDPGQLPEDLAITADQDRRVRAMLERLPDRQRSIVELRLAGLSGAEIGRSLGMSESAVKSAQFRAYALLRELFREHGLAPEHLEPPR